MSQHSNNCPTTYLTFLKKLASLADFFPYQNVHKKTYLNPSDLSEKHYYYYYGVFYTSGNVQRTTTKMTSCLYPKKLVSYTYHICIHTFLKDLIWFDKMLVVCENEHEYEHIVCLLLLLFRSIVIAGVPHE